MLPHSFRKLVIAVLSAVLATLLDEDVFLGKEGC